MSTEKRIKAGDIAKDLRSGLSDAELMTKYQLSLKGLLNLYKSAIDAGVVAESELQSRFASCEGFIALDDSRSVPRVTVRKAIEIYEYEKPEARGVVTDVTERGLRIEALACKTGEIKILVVPAHEDLGVPRLVVEAKCRWHEPPGTGSPMAGFEITRTLKGDIEEFVGRVRSIHAEESELERPGEEEPTETLDLVTAFTEDVTSSGSFSFRGVNKTWFGKLLQALPIPALLVDESHNVTFANKSSEGTNHTGKSVIGEPFGSLFPNSQASKEASAILERVFRTRRRESYHAVMEIDGNRLWARINFRAVRMGSERCILLLIEDLTHEKEQLIKIQEHQEELRREIAERKKVELSLRESEEKYRSLVENAPIGIVSVARDGTIAEANPRFLEILGFPHSESELGEAFSYFLSCEASEMFTDCMKQKWVTNAEIPYVDKTGKDSILRILSTPLLDSSGAVVGCQAAVEDYTEQKKAQEVVLQTARFRAIGEMASGVAHNFNNLLQIVMGNSQMALTHLQWNDLSQIHKNLNNIVESARLGAQTVRRLQDFARTSTESTPVNWKVFDLSRTVAEALEMTQTWWKTAAERDGIAVSVTSRLEPCLVQGMQNEIFEVVVNLIRNAVEALSGKGEIIVSTRQEGGHAILEVQDNGTGIAQENLEHIFAPFWTTKGLQGTGMGLASSYGIVRRHGGEISVESKKAEGSVFTVVIPLASSQPRVKASDPRPSFDFSLNILVADDIEQILETIREVLTSRNQNVLVASSGAEAIEIFESNPIDLVICDLGMADMNGWQVSDRIEKICQSKGVNKPPFVLLTGWGAEVNAQSVHQGHVDHVIEKPVDLNDLFEVVQEVAMKKRD